MLGLLESVRLPTAESERPELGFHFLKRECIRLLGTLCYRDKVIQDKVRRKCLPFLFLNFCCH